MVNLHENRESLRKPLAAHTDYSQFLDPKIQASNVDFMLERRKDFLCIEFKGPREQLSKGETIMLQALATKPGFTVLVYEYEENGFSVLFQILPTGEMIPLKTGQKSLNDYILNWARMRGLPW